MPRYDLVLIDADDTLFDFAKAERLALEAALAPLGLDFDAGLFEAYVRINARAWAELEAGTLDREELKSRRFAELFAEIGVEADARATGETYLDRLSEQAWLIEGAVEACEAIRSRSTLVLLTNGITRVQRGRLSRSRLGDAFHHVVISEEAGYAKPDPRVFELAAGLAGIRDRSRMLMIGDSLGSDIQGGINYGIDSCWYNPGGLDSGALRPAFEIRELREIAPIVERGENAKIRLS